MSIRLPFLMLLPALVGIATRPAISQSAPTASDAKVAMDKGVAWLLRQQQGDGHFPQVPARSDGKESFQGVMTALAIMALYHAGHRPSASTVEGAAMTHGVGYICDQIAAYPESESLPGYLGRFDRSRMYGHGIMGWMLATVAPDLKDRAMRQAAGRYLQGSIVLALRSQQVVKSEQNKGGWRYEPGSSDSDISVTVWQLLALEAAATAGFKIPEEAWTLAGGFLKRTCHTGVGAPSGTPRGFGYEPREDSKVTFSTTAAGVLGMLCCKQSDATETKDGVNYLLSTPVSEEDLWLYYELCHARHVGQRLGGKPAAVFAERARTLLLPLQSEDGSWAPQSRNEKSAGTLYATALAVMVLSPSADSH